MVMVRRRVGEGLGGPNFDGYSPAFHLLPEEALKPIFEVVVQLDEIVAVEAVASRELGTAGAGGGASGRGDGGDGRAGLVAARLRGLELVD